MIIGILQRRVRLVQNVLVPGRSKDRSDSRLTNLTTKPLPIGMDKFAKGFDLLEANEVIQLLARVGEVFAQMIDNMLARPLHLALEDVRHQRHAATAAGPSPGTFLDLADSS